MTAKEYLSQAFILDKQIKAKQTQIQILKDMQDNVSNTIRHDKVQNSGICDRTGELTSALLDLQDEFIVDISRLIFIKYEIKKLIDSLENDTYRLILEERYINLKRWEDVAADNNYSWQHVHKIHSRALLAIVCDTLDKV